MTQRVRFHSISADLRGTRRPSSAPSLNSQQHIYVTSTPHKKLSNANDDRCQDVDSTTSLDNAPSVKKADSTTYIDTTASSANNEKNVNCLPRDNGRGSSYADSFSESYSNYGYSSNNNTVTSTAAPYHSSSSLQYPRSTPIPTPSTQSIPTHHSTPIATSARLIRDEHKENTPPFTPGEKKRNKVPIL